MYQNYKREERLTGIIEGTLKDQTQTLNNINNSLLKLSDRVDTIEDIIDVNQGGMPT